MRKGGKRTGKRRKWCERAESWCRIPGQEQREAEGEQEDLPMWTHITSLVLGACSSELLHPLPA